MVDSCMGDKRNTQDINCGESQLYRRQKKYTRYKLWGSEERY